MNPFLGKCLKSAAILSLALVAPPAFSAANYVYHERTGNDITGGATVTSCGGALPYVDRLTPSSAESYPLRFKVEYQFATDRVRVYYTTDGSRPIGSFGNASNTTQVIEAAYGCTFEAFSQIVDVATATIPPQTAGTTVKYIVSAWKNLDGPEVFANSGTCGTCTAITESGGAEVFQYTVGSTTDLYWDSNGALVGAGATPTGNWGTDSFWSTVLDGSAATGAWTAGRTAVFSAGTDANSAFTVTVTGTQPAGALSIEEGVVTLAGGAVALNGGNLTVHPGATLSTDSSLRLTATAGATVTLNGGTLRTTNPGAAGTFYDADFAITLGALGGTFSHTTANILNIVQTATTIGGPGSLTKIGAGVLAIAGTGTYEGSTIINEGELRIRSNPNRIPVTTAVIVNSPGILNLNNVSQQIGSLSGNGDVGTGGATLTVGDATSTTFSGAIKNVANAGAGGVTSGNGRVVKVGPGMLTLTGSNAFSGTLTVSNGAVVAAAGSVLCDAICDVVVQGGMLNLSNTAQTVLSLSGNGGWVQLGTGHTLTVNPSSTRTYSGQVRGDGSLVKSGTGSLTLAGANTYSGGTTISGGTLRVANTEGSGTGSGPVTVLPGGSVGGPGTIAGELTLQGTISPGASPGTLSSSSQTWSGGGSYVCEINAANGTAGADPGSDLINITGGLTISATPANKFNINLVSLTSTNTAGLVVDFLETTDYAWTIVKTTTGITGFDPAAINISTNGFANPVSNGSFVVETANGGNDLVLRFVHPPSIATGPLAQTVECGASHTFVVTASGTEPLSYQWYRNGNPVGSGDSLTINPVTMTEAGSYHVQVTNIYGAVQSLAVDLTVIDTTAPQITCPAPIVASTDAGQCTASSVTFAPAATDACSVPTVVCTPASGSNFPLGVTAVSCVASDAAGNTNTCSFTVTVNDTELPTITAPPNLTVCADAGQSFATGVALGAFAAADNCSHSVSNNAPSQFPAGTTTVTWTVTDGSGNTASAAQTVTVTGNPVVSVNSQTVCDGASATLTATSDAANPTYLWTPGGATTASITVSPSVTTTYSVTVTDAATSCSSTASGTVTVSPLSSVSVNSLTNCAGNPAILTATTDAANPSFLWSPGGETTASITVSPVSTTTYSVTVTDGNSACSRTASGTVTVTPNHTTTVNSESVCAGGSATLTATTDAANPSYLWSPGGQTTASITVSPSESTSYSVTVTDGDTGCPRTVSGTVTVNPAPAVSVASISLCAGGSGTLTATTTAANPSYLWSPGGETNASIIVAPASTTTYSVTVTDGVTGCSASASGTATVRGYHYFTSSGTISVTDSGNAVPYPAVINVSGLTSTLCRVTVTVSNITHAFPDDLDIVLVGPNGEGVLLMSDVGGGEPLNNVTLKFDENAADTLPDAAQIVAGTYRASNVGTKTDGNPDVFPAPAPQVRFNTSFSVLGGINPNGAWSLYAVDDELYDGGTIGGWSLAISTLNPIAELGVLIADLPDPVAVGSNLVYTITVNNAGPAAATDVQLTTAVPAGTTLVSAGSCVVDGSNITCALGGIDPGASASATITVIPTAAGSLSLSASVAGAQVEFNSADNSASASTTVLNPPVITAGPVNQVLCAGNTAVFSVTATGDEPLAYQWHNASGPMPGETAATLTIVNAQPGQSGSYSVVVNNSVGATSASALLTVNPLPTVTVASSTICIGASATLSALTDAASPTYLWSPGGETTASITVSPTTTTTYSVVVTDGVTGCSNAASATVTVDQLTVASALSSVTNACPGTAVAFTTTASGTGPFTYVWKKNGVVIPDASGESLALAAVTDTDAATYCVEVTGACNTATQCATLTVAVPPVIASQPQSQSRPMGNAANFSVTATGFGTLTYQWQVNGGDIAGATGTTLDVNPIGLADNGKEYRVIVSNCAGSVTSAVAVLTVTPIAGISFDFNTPGQFTNTPANFHLNDWLHTALPSQVIEIASGGAGGSGALDVTGTTDNSSIVHPVSYDFSQDGKTLVASAMVRVVAPSQNNRNTQLGFVTGTNVYAGTAPGLSGAGISDNNPQGFMSVILQSTAQPALTYQLRLQHRRTDGGLTEVTPTPTPQATLTAGTWYKLVATFSNIKGTAANTFSVAASLQDMGANGATPGSVVMSYSPTNIVNTSIPNQRNMFLAIRTARSDTGADIWDNIHSYATSGPIFFVVQPESQTVLQGDQATFRAYVDGTGPYTYQWNRNGSPIAGASNWKYITGPAKLSESGDQYSVTVTGPDGTVINSDPAILTVQADTLSLVSVGSVDGSIVGVRFNQPVDRATAQNPANYLINGASPTAVRIYPSAGADPFGSSVLLTAPGVLTGPYTVTVQNVLDLSGNAIGANNSASGQVEGLVGIDINPLVAQPGGQNYSFAPGQLEISGGGVDIFNSPDAFRYVYSQRSGDFDLKTRVPYQEIVRGAGKSGFEVRASLDPASPHVLAAVNPRWPGRGLYEGTFRQTYNVGGSSWGAAGTAVRYPDAGWLRLRRVGNTFLRYSSLNGVNWQLDGQVSPTPALPETVYVGLAVCSAANGAPALAQFESYGDFAGYPGAAIAITTQPIGSATVAAGASTNLSVVATVTGAPASELSYVWQRKDSLGNWVNVGTAGQTNNTFNTGALFITDNNAEYRVVVRAPGAPEVISSTTTVIVTDAAGPTITAASIPAGSTFQVLVSYSEPVSSASALNTANYALTNAAGSVGVSSAVFLSGDPRVVLLTTASPLGLGNYGLRVSGVQDLNANNLNPNPTLRALSQVGTAPASGPVVVEFYGGLTNSPGIGDLTNNNAAVFAAPSTKFAADTPDFVVYSNVFGINPLNANFPDTLNHYGVQMYSYFVPPTSGAYKFYLRADDFAEFYMNTSAVGSTNPAGAVLQRVLTGNAQTYSAANSVTNTLVGGQRYYMELRFKESTGGDGVSIAVRTDNTVPAQGEVIPASQLAFPDAVAKPTPVVVELYTGQVTLNSTFKNDLGAAAGNGGYPDLLASANSPAFIAGMPNVMGYARYFGFNSNHAQVNATFDNYMGRIYGNFVAPSNGLYKFYVRADDSCELWLNTNAVNSTDPAGKTLLGIVNDFYDANQRLIAQNIYLNGGQQYYMEGRWREGTGGDGMTVTFRAQGDLGLPANTEVMPGTRLEFPSSFDKVGAVNVTLTPQNPVVNEGQTVSFQAVQISGATPYGINWLKNGVQIGANTPNFITQPLTASDNGAVFTLVITNLFSRIERSTTVTVNSDNSVPVIANAVGSQYQDSVVLTFSEAVDPATASSAANYQLNNGVGVLSATLDAATGRRVTLRTTPQTPGTRYTVTANNVRDLAGGAAATSREFTAWIPSGTGFYAEIFANIGSAGSINNLIAEPKFINHWPDATYYTNRLGAGWFGNDTGLNNYGVRLTGFFSPPTNGLYRFYIRGDDGTQLFMNTNGPDPSARVLVARSDGANSGAFDNGIGGSASPILSLNAGTLYFTEAMMKEGGGGDHLEVALRAIDPVSLTAIGGIPAVGVTEIVPGTFFVGVGNPDTAALTVAQAPPADLTVAENDTVTLRAFAYAPNFELSQVTGYQWQKSDGTAFLNIPNAIAPSHTFIAGASDAQYRLVASGPGTNAVYTTTIHSSPDSAGPRLVAATSLTGTNIDVGFNEPIDNISGTDPFNYVVTDANGQPANILGIIQRSDPRNVTIMLDTVPATPFTVDAYAIGDVIGNFGDSSISGNIRTGYAILDVGAPVAPGSSFSLSESEFDVIAGGSDIWGNGDIGHLTLKQISGNFDVRVRVAGLTRPDPIAKAGLMVRETLEPGSRTLHTLVNPSQYQELHPVNPSRLTARDLGEAGHRYAANNGTAAWAARPESLAPIQLTGGSAYHPVGVPNAWLRIKRQGNLFTAMRSYDGVNWLTYAECPFNYPRTVYVGFGTTAHTATQAPNLVTVAQYRDIYMPPAPVILVQPSPSSQTIPLHGSATYSVVASNPPPNLTALTYQWYHNGVAIPNATSDTLNITDAQFANSGVYTVDVSNDGGSTLSVPVTLNVDTGLTAGADALNTVQNVPITVSAATLLGNDTASAGDTANIVAVSGVFPVTFASDFNSGIPAGAAVYGAAGGGFHDTTGGVDNSGVIKLTLNANNHAGSLVLNELAPGRRVTSFNASFKLRIGDGSGEPADGFSFNFAPDLQNTANTGLGENGVGTGFSFCVDNYRFLPYPLNNNAIANTSGLKIRYNSQDIAGVRTITWNSPRFVPVSINVTPEGLLTVMVDGTNVFGNITLPNYAPRAGRFGMYARNGGQNMSQWVDDLSITSLMTVETTREPALNTSAPSLLGSAYINNGVLRITDNINSQAGAYLIEDPAPGEPIESFTASFKLRIGNATAEPADGFSFNLAADLPATATGPRAAEDGMGSGFSFCVDNYRFAPYPAGATANTSGMKIRYNGADIAGVQTATWNNTNFIPVSITVSNDGQLIVLVDGTNVFGNLVLPSWTPLAGRFGLHARTGGQNETHWVDDLQINGVTADGPIAIANDFSTIPPSPYGTVVLSGGNITYTPPANVCGSDTFYYILSGQYGGASIGRVDVTIAEGTPEAPVITTCPTNRTVSVAANCQIALPDLRTELKASDNCCCPTITQDPPPGTLIGVGTTTVTFTVTDTIGLTANCQATLTVIDGQAPVITLVGSDTMIVECHSATIIPGATALDNCSGDLTASVVSTGAADVNVPGTYTIRYNVSDLAGNAALEVVRTVHVLDTLAPLIACSTNITVPCAGPAGSPVNFVVTATDECDAAVAVVCTPASGSVFPVGTTTVNCVATDDAGLTNSCAFTVTVETSPDVELAILAAGADVIISWPETCGTYVLEATTALGTAWTPVAETPVLVSGRWQVTVPAGPGNRFFQLRASP